MGTRSLTHIQDDNNIIATIYRQFDGYPEGHGKDLQDLLSDATLVNGFSLGDEIPATFNGMGCLAAWLPGALKKGEIGSIYLMRPGIDDVGEEYVYTLYLSNGKLYLKIVEYDTTVYDGPLRQFDVANLPVHDD